MATYPDLTEEIYDTSIDFVRPIEKTEQQWLINSIKKWTQKFLKILEWSEDPFATMHEGHSGSHRASLMEKD